MGEIKTNLDLVEKLINIAKNYKTLYVMGCFGAPMTEANKKRYINNGAHNSYNAQTSRKNMINKATSDTFGFDCVCLIKGVLWGWAGDKTKTYGGAKYNSNNVPDINADSMIKACKDVSTDFNNIEIGEAVWQKGHIGIYIGNGLAVECTPAWKNCVQITACNKDVAGYNRRNWTKHGKLPYITYTKSETTKPKLSLDEVVKKVKNGEYGNGAERKKKLEAEGYNYREVQDLVNEALKSKYYPKYTGLSLLVDTVFKAIGVPADLRGSWKKRKPIAEANSIKNYTGTATQNLKLIAIAKEGLLIKV